MTKAVQKTEELRDMPVDKLQAKLVEEKKKLFNLRFQKKLGELSDTSQFVKTRQVVARINTELNRRKQEV